MVPEQWTSGKYLIHGIQIQEPCLPNHLPEVQTSKKDDRIATLDNMLNTTVDCLTAEMNEESTGNFLAPIGPLSPVKISDFGLECCIPEEKLKNSISGKNARA